MYQYTPSATWHNTVSNFDTTDVVQGGSGGTDNVPLKELADNTSYLYDLKGKYEGITNFNNSTTGGVFSPTVSDLYRKLLRFYIVTNANNGTINLPDVTTYPAGGIVEINVKGDYNLPVKIAAYGSQNIYSRMGIANWFYLHKDESVKLYRNGSSWEVLSTDGNLYNVLSQRFGYMIEPGTLKRDGSILYRAQYPRLWEMLSNNASALIVSEVTWMASIANQSFFSSGDGSTTFRLPDDRGMFDRAMDLNRNIDTDRYATGQSSTVGSYQADDIKSHKHGLSINGNNGTLDGYLYSAGSGGDPRLLLGDTQYTGGAETRPKNVGKIPLIVF